MAIAIVAWDDGLYARREFYLPSRVSTLGVYVRFFIDPDTGEPHIYAHGVEENEVEDVLLSPGKDRRGRGNSRIAIGRTRRGRYLRVIYLPHSDPDELFVITAYELRGKQLATFRRRMRRRGR